jgi:hypothetical protein
VIQTRLRRATAVGATATAVALLLSGCGGSLGIHPGAAATVGDRTVSMSKIDDDTTLYCKAYVTSSQQSQQGGQSGPIPLGLFRSYVASGLANRLLGQALADQYAVQPASGYQQQVSQIQQALATAPDDQRQAVLDVAASDAYLQNVQVAIGQKLTGSTGTSNPELKAALQRGEVATQDWLDDHHTSIDPVFGVGIQGGKFTTVQRQQTSYPLSPLASGGAEAATSSQGPAASYTSALPANQLCQ